MKKWLVFWYLEAQALKRKLGLFLFAKRSDTPHIQVGVKLSKQWLGSVYGGFYAHLPVLNAQSNIISIGIGKDITFDKAIIRKTGAKVFGFDPTPKSIAFVDESELPNKFQFFPSGITHATTGTYPFQLPENPKHVSGRADDVSGAGQLIQVELLSFSDMVAACQIKRVEVLKMDIEGYEYKVVPSILETGIEIDQFLIEIHDRFFEESTPPSKDLVELMQSYGYQIFGVSLSREEISFIHRRLL
jgi:FkbM family methyltransferase